MRALFLVSAAFATTSAAHSQPVRQQQYACIAHAQGGLNEDVGVVVQVDATGQLLGSYAVWAPPATPMFASRDLDQPDLRLGIRYSGSTAQSIGTADLLRAQATAFSPLRERVPITKLRKRLASLRVDYVYDGVARQRAKLAPQDDALALPGIASSTADLPFPVLWPRQIEIKLSNQKGVPLNAVTYLLSGTESRDALYHSARKDALALTAHPTSCDPAGDMAGQPPFL